jgi:methylornithine synthase
VTDQPGISEVESLSRRAVAGEALGRRELARLLAVADRETAAPLFAAACELRRRHFSDAVFTYGFVYFSTYCRNRCTFCFYRSGNRQSPRYRKTVAEVAAICRDLAASGVDLLDLTMGEDPVIHQSGHFAALSELVAAVRDTAGLAIMVSPGVVPAAALADLRAHGADWYACYQETHNERLYAALRPGQDYAARTAAREAAHAAGLLVEDGILTGVGETIADRAASIVAMRDGQVEQARVMGLVPQRGTPMAARPAPDTFTELTVIAVMRLALPDRLIPASLDVAGLAGLDERMLAGANVVTSLVPPTVGLAGVSQSELDIEQGLRTVPAVAERLRALGLRAAAKGEYGTWLAGARERLARRRAPAAAKRAP